MKIKMQRIQPKKEGYYLRKKFVNYARTFPIWILVFKDAEDEQLYAYNNRTSTVEGLVSDFKGYYWSDRIKMEYKT